MTTYLNVSTILSTYQNYQSKPWASQGSSVISSGGAGDDGGGGTTTIKSTCNPEKLSYLAEHNDAPNVKAY